MNRKNLNYFYLLLLFTLFSIAVYVAHSDILIIKDKAVYLRLTSLGTLIVFVVTALTKSFCLNAVTTLLILLNVGAMFFTITLEPTLQDIVILTVSCVAVQVSLIERVIDQNIRLEPAS